MPLQVPVCCCFFGLDPSGQLQTDGAALSIYLSLVPLRARGYKPKPKSVRRSSAYVAIAIVPSVSCSLLAGDGSCHAVRAAETGQDHHDGVRAALRVLFLARLRRQRWWWLAGRPLLLVFCHFYYEPLAFPPDSTKSLGLYAGG